jgi:phosphoglycolate phosphatase-like HAD superfamily hydrolase
VTRDHWRWRDGEIVAGPAVVFDVDGVLADASGRQHLLQGNGRRKNWQAFFAAAGNDAVIDEVARLTHLLDRDLAVVLLTARPTTIQDLTFDWLGRADLRWDLLVMRPAGEYMPSPDAKRVAVRELRQEGFELRLAIDDDRRNVDMFHSEGVPCIYLHSGYYEA